MKQPLHHKIQLDIKEQKIGAIQSDSISEYGDIIAVGQDVDTKLFKIGARIYFKAWAVDIITLGEEKLYFISDDSDAMCAIDYKK